MSETMIRTAEAQEYQDLREREAAAPKDEQNDDNDPYCCTPPDGNGGPDTKP
jgi:hypothetical protein